MHSNIENTDYEIINNNETVLNKLSEINEKLDKLLLKEDKEEEKGLNKLSEDIIKYAKEGEIEKLKELKSY